MASKIMLDIKGLKASVDGKPILKGVDLKVKAGEIHIIMGPNGAGKSTLANVLMGHPGFVVDAGQAYIEGKDLLDLSVDERAKAGLFLSFQYPEEVPGITVENFLRTAKNALAGKPQGVIAFNKALMDQMDALGMDRGYAKRYLNQGFSGGEKKKNEILQMMVLDPKVAILDETDSGLDVDAIKVVAEGVKTFAKDPTKSIVIITHYNKLLSYLEPDYVHILKDGQIIQTGDQSLADAVDVDGFARML